MLELFTQMFAQVGHAAFGTITGPELAHQHMRRRLLELIAEKPGIHASELARESGEPWGTVQYHLSLLDKGDMVTTVEAGRERCFFPTEMDPVRAQLLALLHQGRRLEIANYIQSNPGARQVDICGALDVSRKTFRNAVSPLVEEGLVHERRGLSQNQYFPQETLAPAISATTPMN